MLLGESLEDYLECIAMLSENEPDGRVRSVDIARHLHVSKPSVNKAMNVLKEKGLIRQEAYSGIELTKAGKEMAAMILNRHNTIHYFLRNVLGVSEENAEHDACKIEHHISEESFNAIKNHAINFGDK